MATASLIELSTRGYGAANVGNLYRALDEGAAIDLLESAWSAGIRYFDTAPHYGLGLSERRLGAFLRTKPRDEYVVSTKVGRLLREVPNPAGELDWAHDFAVPADFERVWNFGYDGIRTSIEDSLERMGLDRVDLVYLHDPEKYDLAAASTHAYPALIRLREEGLVSAVGVGSMSVEAVAQAARTPGLDVLMVAGRLTLAEQLPESVLWAALDNGIRLVAAGVYNSGVLAHAWPADDARYEYGAAPASLLEHVRAIATVCREFDVELPTAAMQYPLTVPGVISVVFGGSTPEQIVENVRRATMPVAPELWVTLRDRGLTPSSRDRDLFSRQAEIER
jgi:D-threo-aldose 1-dehydrogenase